VNPPDKKIDIEANKITLSLKEIKTMSESLEFLFHRTGTIPSPFNTNN